MAIMARSFLRPRLAAGGELGHRAARRGLRHLAAGVGVDLGVEHQDVDIAAARPARDPGRRSRCRRPSRRRRGSRRSSSPARRPALSRSRASRRAIPASFCFSSATRSRCASMPASSIWSASSRACTSSSPNCAGELGQQFAGVLGLLVDRQPHAQAELGVVFEQRVGPGDAAPVLVERVRRGRQVAAVDRRAAGGVGDHRAVAEQAASSA